jgi:TPR repeat protein
MKKLALVLCVVGFIMGCAIVESWEETDYRLGEEYYKGNRSEGYPQDYKKAAYWYKKAAVKDNAVAHLAQYRLGDMYYKGLGVPRDYKKATEWYEKAAGQGNTEALAMLSKIKNEHILGIDAFEVDGEMRDINTKPITGIVKTFYRNGNLQLETTILT